MSRTGNAYAVILAGGKGERFWPLSTRSRPKQFVALLGRKCLLQMTAERLGRLFPPERMIVLTNAAYVKAVRSALPRLDPRNVVGEPTGRDTGAACALAMALVSARDKRGVMCVFPADHLVENAGAFAETVRECIKTAGREDVLITIGITPSFPSTGLGYIEAGKPMPRAGKIEFVRVRRFVEKPDARTASKFVRSGAFCWNAGIFVWSVPVLRRALARHCPRFAKMAERVEPEAGRRSFAARVRTEYAAMPKLSIDYALMEKADNVVMARGCFDWDDVGSWSALEKRLAGDSNGNSVLGECAGVDSSGNIVVSRGRLTALVGVKDLVVVNAAGTTLVCAKNRAQDVKKLVQVLQKKRKYRDLF